MSLNLIYPQFIPCKCTLKKNLLLSQLQIKQISTLPEITQQVHSKNLTLLDLLPRKERKKDSLNSSG